MWDYDDGMRTSTVLDDDVATALVADPAAAFGF